MREISDNSGARVQPRPGSGLAPRPGAGFSRPTARGQDRADPFPAALAEIEAAFGRLRTLLAFDGESGPRDGVPRRGFYLNILV